MELRFPNAHLRNARQSMRLSQAQFAQAIRIAGHAMGAPNFCNKRLVQKWETGEHASCRPDYLRVLQMVTGLSARELGFEPVPDESGMIPGIGREEAAEHADGESSRGAGAARAAVAVPWTSSRDILADSIERLRYSIEHPSMVEMGTTHLVEASILRLFDLEQHSPARLLAPSVQRHLGTVTALLAASRDLNVRRSLTGSAGIAALLAGWLEFDRGDNVSALTLWDSSASAAGAVVNDALLAATLMFQSYAAARQGDSAAAWQLAHDASSLTLEDPRASAWSLSRVALCAAQVGERAAAEEAVRRALEFGEELPNPAPGDGGQPWTRSFGHAALLASAGHTRALLKDQDAALDCAVRAVEALSPAVVKMRAVVLAEAALTTAILGEFKLCLEYGSDAADLARAMGVSVAAEMLHEVASLLLPHADRRAVQELLPQLTGLTRSADRHSDEQRDG